MKSQKKYAVLGLVSWFLVLLSSCGPNPQFGTIMITGVANDMVLVEFGGFTGPSCCTSSQCLQGMVVQLDRNGQGRAAPLDIPAFYVLFSRTTNCRGFTQVQCPPNNTVAATCFPVAGFVAQGEITIAGLGVNCDRYYDYDLEKWVTVCNTTTVTLNIDGSSVSAAALVGSTAASLAADLVTQINSDPVMGTKVIAGSLNNTIMVQARQQGAAYTYPWQASCAVNPRSPRQCAFTASLSPIATLGGGQ